MPNEPSEVGDPKMHEIVDPIEGIEMRWGLREDETWIAELLGHILGPRRAGGGSGSLAPAAGAGRLRVGSRRAVLCRASHPGPDVGVGLRDQPRPDVRVGTMS